MPKQEPTNQIMRNQMIAAGGLIIVVSLLTFASWLGSGKQMMVSLIQSGLAWCL